MKDELKIEAIEDVVADLVLPVPKGSPEWNDYVLSHLRDDELFNGYPKVDGLRRVAELVFGEILESRTEIVAAPSKENDMTCTAVHHIVFSDPSGKEKEYSGAADAGQHNINGEFTMYPTAIAETRAEGRALRRALNLKTVTAEELASTPKVEMIVPPNLGALTDTQKSSLNKLCGTSVRGMNVNVAALAKKLLNKDISDLSKDDGAELLKHVTEMQRNEKLLTDDVRGYEVW